MKVTPVVGTGAPAGADVSNGKSVSSDARARAIAVASGQEPQPSTGDAQADRAQADIKKIKMRTQVSTDRDNPVVEAPAEIETQSPISDTKESGETLEETKPLSPQFAALAKAKRALQVKERELAQREEALKTHVPQTGTEDLIAKLKANPLNVLQEAGVTYDQLTEAILNNQSAPLDSKSIDALVEKKLNERLEKEFGSRDTQAEQQVLADIKREAVALTSQGDQFEAIREAKAQNVVVDLIHRTFKQTGEIMDVSEAADLVENQLIDEALPFARLKKIQTRLTPEQAEVLAQAPTSPKAGTKVMKTLTNRDSAKPVMDRRARAIAAALGTLKKG